MKLISLENDDIIRKMLLLDDMYKDLRIDDIMSCSFDKQNIKWFIGINEQQEPLGFLYVKQPFPNTICFHGGVYKKYRGKESLAIVKEALRILRGDNKFVYITTVPVTNIAAQKFDEKLGFKFKTTIFKGYNNNEDLLLYGEK